MARRELNAVDFAIYQQVWKLPRECVEVLDKFYLVKMNPEEFMMNLDQSHDWQDFISIDGIRYAVHYFNCCPEMIEDHGVNIKEYFVKDVIVHISCRVHYESKQKGIALVRFFFPAKFPFNNPEKAGEQFRPLDWAWTQPDKFARAYHGKEVGSESSESNEEGNQE